MALLLANRCFGIIYIGQASPPSSTLSLWYGTAAHCWQAALPVGNGRLGAMVYGIVNNDTLSLDESSVWSGGPTSDDNTKGASLLPSLQKAFLPPLPINLTAANNLFDDFAGTMNNYGTSRPFGNLIISFTGIGASDTVSNYCRSLDLSRAVSDVSFEYKGAQYLRETFSSNPDQVIVMRFSCNQPGKISFTAGIKVVSVNGGTGTMSAGGTDTLLYNGQVYEGTAAGYSVTAGPSMATSARLLAVNSGGTVSASGSGLVVQNADTVVLLLAMGTSYRSTNPATTCQQQIAAASVKSYGTLLSNHSADYQNLFNRVTLNLGAATLPTLPTDRRLAQVNSGTIDPNFDMLWYQYSRYLLISSSRENSPLPMHLQGLWNDNQACNMVWNCDYHLDINAQQNQWLATTGNLPETNVSVINFIENVLVPKGTTTATVNYGKPGWVAHWITNAWGWSSNFSGYDEVGAFETGGIWFATELWKQFDFYGDTALLRTSYPTLKAAAQFFMAEMVTYPGTNYLVDGPTCSPENGNICMMSTCDRANICNLFTECINCCNILNTDSAFKAEVIAVQDSLPPLKISQYYGQLQEWYTDTADNNDGCRHTSHLVTVFPYDDITPEDCPGLSKAALISLERRLNTSGAQNVEWSVGNAECYFAQFKDGDSAYKQLNYLRQTLTDTNLLTVSPPGIAGASNRIFAIDGNMSSAAGIGEMLLQSHRNRIEFLPALPKAWPTGSATGLVARGAFVVNLTWQNSKFVRATILSNNGNRCYLQGTGYYVYDQNNIAVACSTSTTRTVLVYDTAGVAKSCTTSCIRTSFATVAGMSYTVTETPTSVKAATRPSAPSGAAKSFEVTGDKFTVPAAFGDKLVCLYVYDLTGRLQYRAIIKKRAIDLRRDFGLPSGSYIIKCIAAP